jgi:hypothetical protein
VSPRLRAEAAAVARGTDPVGIIAAVERFFRSRRLYYANSGLPVGKDPLDSFLFREKRGNCEYFASSCALLLRLCGVPCRLVGGYRGGIYSDVGGYYLVTEDTAHVWVEAYLEGRGWVEVDPSEWSQGVARPGGFAARARVLTDLFGFYWNRAVVTYDLEKQIALVRVATQKVRGVTLPRPSGRLLFVLAAAAAAVGLSWYWYRWHPATPEERLLRAFLRIVARRLPDAQVQGMGLYELERHLGDPLLSAFVATYGDAIYRDRRLTAHEVRRCRELLREAAEHPS